MADAPTPANRVHSLLTPQNCTVIFIDHQPQMTFGVMSIDRQLLFNNVIGLAKAAKIFQVPVILTTVETKGFSGYMWPDLLELFPGQEPIERTSMNAWEDRKFVAAVEKAGRKKLVIAALWTEVCLAFPAIQALEAGYEVYAVEELGTQGRRFVSLKLPETDANRVAAAAERGRVRLVLVGR